MALKIKTAPVKEPVTLAEAKSHLRVEIADDDTLINTLIKAAREHVEKICSRALITQTWYLYLDSFPDSGEEIRIPMPPLATIVGITYVDIDGVTQTLAVGEYTVDANSEPARVKEAYNETWPDTREIMNAVTVEFTCGYGDDETDVPQTIRQAMLFLIGHWYENREAVVISGNIIAKELPAAVSALLASYRIITVL
jgi:uncharacterized phiE125 gp8 family phage protein